jgi:CheY-like chemotaxis protein
MGYSQPVFCDTQGGMAIFYRQKHDSSTLPFAVHGDLCQTFSMSKPLALVYYSNLMPGSQLANRLQDLGYRVQSLNDLSVLAATCEREKPLVVIAEWEPSPAACSAVAELKNNPATRHVPVLAFAASHDPAMQSLCKESGASILAADAAIADQLPQLLDQILQVE